MVNEKPGGTTPKKTTQTTEKRKGLKVVGEAEAPEIKSVKRPDFLNLERPTRVEGKPHRAGLWHLGIKQTRDGEGIPVDTWVSQPLFVVTELEDSETGHVGRLVVFWRRGGRVELPIPMEEIAVGEEAIKALLRMGFIMDINQKKRVLEYIVSRRLETVIKSTTKTGFHPSGAFVLPFEILPKSAPLKYQGSVQAAEIFQKKGDLPGWKKEVAKLCEGNHVLIFSVCCALTGPLLRILGVAGGGFHLVGDSSSGKSLAQLVAATIWGDPGRFCASWAVTKNGLEIEAATRSETVLLLDEIKRALSKYVQEMAYALGNGMGKSTMTAERGARVKLTWRLFFLSSGERSLAEHAALSGNAAHAGAELRMVDINAGTRRFRAFDDAHGMTGEAFHRALSVAVTNNYGHAGRALVEAIISGKEKDDIPALYERLREQFQSNNAQAGRVADRFCTVATAGEYAIEKGVLPWPSGTALASCKKLFNEWLSTMGTGNVEDRQILQGISDFLAAHGDSRFSPIRDIRETPPTVHNRAGYYDQQPGGDHRLYLFFLHALKEAAAGFSKDRIVKALLEAGALQLREGARDSHPYQQQYRLAGGNRVRLYAVAPEKLDLNQ